MYSLDNAGAVEKQAGSYVAGLQGRTVIKLDRGEFGAA